MQPVRGLESIVFQPIPNSAGKERSSLTSAVGPIGNSFSRHLEGPAYLSGADLSGVDLINAELNRHWKSRVAIPATEVARIQEQEGSAFSQLRAEETPFAAAFSSH
jgi:hypothetical protein